MKSLIQWLTAASVLIAFTALNTANAHTTSIGFVPGANPGEVTFWTGSYHPSGVNEGTLTLTGVSVVFGPDTRAFNITPVTVKPAGLIDGTNNCYWPSSGPLDCTMLSDPSIAGVVRLWQGITFTGLSAGTYDFSCGATCGTTVVWNSWTSSGAGRVTLTAGDIGGGPPTVPEPGILALMSLGLIGLGFQRRKFNK